MSRRFAVVAFASALTLIFFATPFALPRDPASPHPLQLDSRSSTSGPLRVAVVEQTSWHEEVIGVVLNALNNVGVNATLYRHGLGWGYDRLLVDIYPDPPLPIWDLPAAIDAQQYDVVVLVSCDSKFIGGWTELLAALYASTARVVCFPHELESWGHSSPDVEMLAPLGSEGRLDFVALAPHSGRALAHTVRRWPRIYSQPWWETTPIHHVTPLYPVPGQRQVHRAKITRAGILGHVLQTSRDYEGIMRDLEKAIVADPGLWGYKLENRESDLGALAHGDGSESESDQQGGGEDGTYNLAGQQPLPPYRLVPANDHEEPFTLHFIGRVDPNLGPVPVFPPLLVDQFHPVVQVRDGVDYTSFYGAIRDMDIILPAFVGNHYLDWRASSAIPVAIMGETPVLVTSLILEAYTYLGQPAYIQAPSAMGEVDALAILRRGGDPLTEMFGERDAEAERQRQQQLRQEQLERQRHGHGGQLWGDGWDWLWSGGGGSGGRGGGSQVHTTWEGYVHSVQEENALVWQDILWH